MLKREVEIRDAEIKPSLNPLKEAVWKLTTSPKIKVFLWKTLCNAIPAGELLIKRSIKMDPTSVSSSKNHGSFYGFYNFSSFARVNEQEEGNDGNFKSYTLD
ncbi:unnamed protein product [Brassica rapa]|uniref:Reverse transcriptase zinc-binding domain-containing protein n=1 Tax=Brassica campestris TaxID=3711 RepID=A0A3P5YHM8_BRACM|nr:unnamed protein product [Brassica rapa]VDC67197.1 unnamed protein product [Brassica rapa]